MTVTALALLPIDFIAMAVFPTILMINCRSYINYSGRSEGAPLFSILEQWPSSLQTFPQKIPKLAKISVKNVLYALSLVSGKFVDSLYTRVGDYDTVWERWNRWYLFWDQPGYWSCNVWYWSCWPVIYFHLMLMSTGCLAPLAPMVIPGSQYSN